MHQATGIVLMALELSSSVTGSGSSHESLSIQCALPVWLLHRQLLAVAEASTPMRFHHQDYKEKCKSFAS
jgi:hypothetical protein